jgi:hypothetical protein
MMNDRINPQGSVISQLRRRLSMTQEEFAHAIGVTVSLSPVGERPHRAEPLARKAMQGLATQARSPSTSKRRRRR